MFTPSSVSSYPTYTPLPGVPSKTDGITSGPRLREIRVVNGGESLPHDDYVAAQSGYFTACDSPRSSTRDGMPYDQRYNAPIYAPTGAVQSTARDDRSGTASLSQLLRSAPAAAPLAAQTPHLYTSEQRGNAACTRSQPADGPASAHSFNGTSHSPLVFRAPLEQRHFSQSPPRHHHAPQLQADNFDAPPDTRLQSHDRLQLVAAECEDLLWTLRGESSPHGTIGRPSELRSPPRGSAIHHNPTADDGLAEPTRLGTSASSPRSGYTDDDASRGYLHEPQPTLTGRGKTGTSQRQGSEAFAVVDSSRATYNALMSALEALAAEQHTPEALSPHDEDDDSNICVAPPDLAPELDTPADLITPFTLKWLLFLVQRREKRLTAQTQTSGSDAPEDAALVLKMAVTLRESLHYLQSASGTTMTRAKAQQLNQLLLYISNLVSRFARDDDLWQQRCGQSRAAESAVCDELKRTAEALSRVLDEKESLANALAVVENDLQMMQHQVETLQSEKDALTSHYDRVAADNAEILSRLQEAEEAAKAAHQRDIDREADERKSTASTTSTERRCAMDAMQEEYDRLQALMNRQTNTMRDLRGDLDEAESENDQLRAVIAQLRQSVVRHRTVVDLLTRRKREGGVGLPEPSSQLIDDILSGVKTLTDPELETDVESLEF